MAACRGRHDNIAVQDAEQFEQVHVLDLQMPIPDRARRIVAALDDELSWKIVGKLADGGRTTWQDLWRNSTNGHLSR